MSKPLACVAVVAVVAAVFLAPTAEAGPVWKSSLVSADAGSTNTVQMDAKRCYCVQALYANTCIKFGTWDGGTAALSADCSKDFIVPSPLLTTSGSIAKPTYCFDSSGRTGLVARNVDAGASNVELFTLELNPANPYGCTTGPGGVGF